MLFQYLRDHTHTLVACGFYQFTSTRGSGTTICGRPFVLRFVHGALFGVRVGKLRCRVLF